MASITYKYSDPVHFNNLLTEIGLNDIQAARLESDGFTMMGVLVSHYQTSGASDLEKYIRDLNKTFTNAVVALRVYYNPVIINCLCGCLTYFLLCVYSFHTILDIGLIDVATAGNLGSFWTKFNANKKIKSNKSDDGTNIDLPKLKGA